MSLNEDDQHLEHLLEQERHFRSIAEKQLDEKVAELRTLEHVLHTRTVDLTKAKEQAEKASKAKSEFLATMSHEIRTPLAGVIGLADLLTESDLEQQELNWVSSIKASGEGLLSILNEILDQSKLEAGKLEIDPIDFHLPTMFEEAFRLFSTKFAEKNLRLEVRLAKDLPSMIHADRMRVTQILTNLLSNALKFTDEGTIRIGSRVIETCAQHGLLEISVEDTGVGLTPEAADRLFAPFEQEDGSTSRKYGGTGLGLSISKQLAELMGGTIGVESQKGHGSKFWFTIQYDIPEVPKLSTPERRQSVDRWIAKRPLDILVAEDVVLNQTLIRTLMERVGHTISIAENGQQAVEMISDQPFDLVLMDIRMPIMDGVSATEIIRKMDGPSRDIPIIALTADMIQENVNEFLAAGMNAACQKPVNLPEVLSAIDCSMKEIVHESIDQADLAPATENEEHEMDDTFNTVLQRISGLIDQQRSLKADPPASKGDLFRTLHEEFLVNMKQIINELGQNCLPHIHDGDKRQCAIGICEQVKGAGRMFGYNLLSQVATRLEDILIASSHYDDQALSRIDNHIRALQLIMFKGMNENGGKAGRILLQALSS